ncbi:MAG: SOS response-associated peptidase family protein [Ignavibacteria bacterium]|nr:SOS response-associated peptidase family protein [Ignavibacteria bacterium]
MCSRFENKESGISIFKKLDKNSNGEFILEEFEDVKNENIAPTDRIIAILKENDKFRITEASWGIRFKDEKTFPLIFNSRIETIRKKPYWENLFKINRCLVPATAFYEWRTVNNRKIPLKIILENSGLFFFSSVYSVINNKLMVSIITTEPNRFMKNIHTRMPHIIKEENFFDFFNDESNKFIKEIQPLDDKIPMEIEEI